MKNYFLAFIALGLVCFTPNAFAAGYSYYRAITVTSTTSIASGTNASFPMLFGGTYTWLESSSTAGGAGKIQNLVTAPNGGQEPADLVFATSSLNCNATPLNFEPESYVSSTGAINDWVNVPSLSAGTVIYACYGNSAVATDQSNPSSTWNSNYKGVWHLPNGSSLSYTDSTGNNNAGSANGSPTAVAGEIDGGMGVTGGSGMSITNNFTASPWTYSAWFKGAGGFYGSIWGGGYNGALEIRVDSGNTISVLQMSTAGVLTTSATYTSNAWNYVAVTWDGSTLKIYLNNQTPASTAFTAGFNNYGNDLGYGYNGEDFTGSLDEARQVGAVLSASWIATEYNNQNSPSTFYTLGNQASLVQTYDPYGECAE